MLRGMRGALARLLWSCLLLGCVGIPKDALVLSPEALADRHMQTRRFDTGDEVMILRACGALLQDFGFNLDDSETALGMLVASKERSAVEPAQVATALAFALLGAQYPIDTKQLMRASVISRPIGEQSEQIAVRVTFQRIVWNSQNQVTKREGIRDPAAYQEFFDKLSKAIFLEAHQL